MKYIHIRIIPQQKEEEVAEIIIARLSDLPFESFSQDGEGISAYMPEHVYNKDEAETLLEDIDQYFPVSWMTETIAEQNWNRKWEEYYEPVLVAGKIYIRAPFHEPMAEADHEIIIEPKMSFGTAHHETTQQMMELMLDMDWKNRSFLDMGCGTGILAILASRLGAAHGLAIDNDKWAFENCRENLLKNAITNVEPLLGDQNLIGKNKFDFILANINRNILLGQMEAYASSLNDGGSIVFSGFYETDVPILLEKATEFGFRLKRKISRNGWVAMEVQ
ncbi:MAG: 50S ribosomal protein L11 methyltransferase [Bacteroidales bacterium]